ncbi:MAG: DNA-directed RNA polymerase subunit D [Nitrososphaerota archaeon]|nr:DNA-directed RNA polymerase subunit D [Candidatus Calditenuis fumarioli]
MEARVLRDDGKSIELELKGVPLSIANAIRRHLINEVPTMAVEEVMVIENSSSVYNEVLAHRISLIPFKTDLDNFVLPEECDCGNRLGCDRCVVRFSLRAKAVSEVVTVYSRDLVRETGTEVVEPVSGDFPIVKLAPGQAIEMELYVRLGTGKKHAKWIPGIATLYDGPDGSRTLYFESFGFLPPARAVLEAAKIFEKRTGELERVLMEALGDAGKEA